MSFDTQLTNRVTTNLQPYLWTGLDIAFVSSLFISHIYTCIQYKAIPPFLHTGQFTSHLLQWEHQPKQIIRLARLAATSPPGRYMRR